MWRNPSINGKAFWVLTIIISWILVPGSSFQSLPNTARIPYFPSSRTTSSSLHDASNDNNNHHNGATAVILNTNARGVTKSLVPLCQELFGTMNVFVTTSGQEARQACQTILAKKHYKLVVPIGGDGTLAQAINDYCDAYLRDTNQENATLNDAMDALPLLGYIPLGTGNGVGSSVGCQLGSVGGGTNKKRRRFWNRLPFVGPRKNDKVKSVLEALSLVGERLQQDLASGKSREEAESRFNVAELPMIEVCRLDEEDEEDEEEETNSDSNAAPSKGDLCFFAGVGFDSLMLDDFKSVKRWSLKTGFLPRILGSVVGYSVALVTLTLPKALTRGEHKIHVTLKTSDEETLWVDHRPGDYVKQVAKAEPGQAEDKPVTIFSGITGICCAGTSPYYGGGLRLFPFARLTLDNMHLRLGRINPLVGFVNIPRIFEGSYREPSERFGVIDFIGKDFQVDVKRTRRSNIHTDTNERNGRRGFPFQHSGESQGNFERFRLRATNRKVRFVNFMEKRCITCDDDYPTD